MRQKHVMTFKSHADITPLEGPSTLIAHRLTRADLERYDSNRGCFRGQRLRFAYSGIVPKAGDFIVRYEDDEAHPVATGIVVLVGARRFYEITGDVKALKLLGTLTDEAACL